MAEQTNVDQCSDTGRPDERSPIRTAPAARALGLSKVYGSGDTRVAALRGVNVEFHPGQFTAIMGPSGSGKSTLMHCLAALDQATSGRVFVGDADSSHVVERTCSRSRSGWAPG